MRQPLTNLVNYTFKLTYSIADKLSQITIAVVFYLAFSNSSDNRNYGSGDPKEGDLQGWINRGFSWEIKQDSPGRYEIAVGINYPGIVYPVTADMTLRRRQQFKFPAGTQLEVLVNGEKRTAVIDKNNLLTIEKIKFPSSGKITVVITGK